MRNEIALDCLFPQKNVGREVCVPARQEKSDHGHFGVSFGMISLNLVFSCASFATFEIKGTFAFRKNFMVKIVFRKNICQKNAFSWVFSCPINHKTS